MPFNGEVCPLADSLEAAVGVMDWAVGEDFSAHPINNSNKLKITAICKKNGFIQ